MLGWLLQGGPHDSKHRGKIHPVVTFFIHYVVVAWVSVAVHDWMIVARETSNTAALTFCITPPIRQSIGAFFGLYFVMFFSTRLALRWKQTDFYVEFYRQTFLCSVTIFHVFLGLYTDRIVLAQSFCVAVGIDQILWYVDLAGYLILRYSDIILSDSHSHKFPIGVSKYLFWPGTTWASRLTSTHHLWTIPLVMYASGGGIHPLSLPLSVIVVSVNVLLSRLLTPHSIVQEDNKKHPPHYLNLNLAYELWSDINFPFLLILEDRIPYLYRLFVAWWSFNAVVFALLSYVSNQVFGPPLIC